MTIYKTADEIIIVKDGWCFVSKQTDWDHFINRDALFTKINEEIKTLQPAGDLNWLGSQHILAPIGSQEVWAAGVTYLRSKTARMEESKDSGGANFYDKVYDADRPELFFKATAARVVGPNQQVRIRRDSSWNVPALIRLSARLATPQSNWRRSSAILEGQAVLCFATGVLLRGARLRCPEGSDAERAKIAAHLVAEDRCQFDL